MLAEVAGVSVAPLLASVGSCELCATASTELNAGVVVRHPRGGVAQFSICGRCALALSRLAAAAGGQARFSIAEGVRLSPNRWTDPNRPVYDRWGLVRAELIHELADPLVDDGTSYVTRIYGGERRDGSWIGWIEFVADGAAETLRTERETTQSNREHLAYWATGLQPLYLEGALARARSAQPVSTA